LSSDPDESSSAPPRESAQSARALYAHGTSETPLRGETIGQLWDAIIAALAARDEAEAGRLALRRRRPVPLAARGRANRPRRRDGRSRSAAGGADRRRRRPARPRPAGRDRVRERTGTI